eukprot:6461551-Amphidinium_carterae.1
MVLRSGDILLNHPLRTFGATQVLHAQPDMHACLKVLNATACIDLSLPAHKESCTPPLQPGSGRRTARGSLSDSQSLCVNSSRINLNSAVVGWKGCTPSVLAC